MTRPRRLSYLRPAGYYRRKLLVAVALLLVAALLYGLRNQRDAPAPEGLAEGSYQVRRVVDGDTLLLTNGARVRLIGADTPETVKPDHPIEPQGREATEFTRRFIEGGQVRLQMDREKVDKFGRFLAYVWVGDQMLNEELIRSGLARARLEFHYSQSMKTRFRKAQEEARTAQRGIWSP